MHTDGVSTVSTVQWESRADVDDRAGSEGDGKVEAAGGAAATIWEEIGSEGYEGSSEEALEEFRRGPMAAFRPPSRRRPRAMVMFGVRLQSQRRLLLVWQESRFFQVSSRYLSTMLGPQCVGSTTPLN